MSGLYGVGVSASDVTTALQNAAAAPKLIRASKTFTGAANLGAVGVNELFTTTGAVVIDGFWVHCTDDLVDAVDGAFFEIGVTGTPSLWTGGAFLTPFDLDTIDAGDGINTDLGTAVDGYSYSGAFVVVIFDNIIMTISAQAITGGTLEFYILYRPLSSDGALTLGAGMTQI